MSFQIPTTTTASAGGFSFGLSNTQSTTVAPATTKAGLSFGTTGGGDAGPKSFSFGLTTTATGSTPSSTTATSVTATPSLGFGSGSVGFGGLSSTSTTATISLATTTSSSSAAPVATGFTFGSSTTAPTTTSASTTTAAALTTLSAAAPVTSTSLAPTASGFASLTTATKTTDSSAAVNPLQLSYNQLEEHINKWTLELEEQEKVFTDQATQINAWDKILISNNQKILELNDAVQKVKSDQQTLEQELEFIATQHKELEESIIPLQKEFMKIPQVDVERSQTYLLVENLDTQLKQMSEDLKEIIDNLNEANKGQDNTDPIIQIGKILNAHMNSLQWIEASTSTINNKLEEITKMHESFKRDSERSFRSAYYN